MRLFVRAAGWGRGYYWTEVAADSTRDAGQVPVEHYFELLRNQDSLAPSMSLYHSAAGFQLLCLGLTTRRNEPTRRVITNSLLLEWPEERSARLFAAAVLAGPEAGPVFRAAFERELDRCIDHDSEREHYHVDAPQLRRLLQGEIVLAEHLGEPDPFPDDVFLERLFARNSPERRRELQAALCRYELPALPARSAPQLLLAVAGLEDAQRLCDAGAWIALSERCSVETWTVFGAPGPAAHPPLRDRC
jgi:hypothetical protein